ncbi:MAG TPA: hypothetical protein VFB50_06595 [Chloroflexota bacterium]|nr:hypothetical protein [Chloroflexota bacterium]
MSLPIALDLSDTAVGAPDSAAAMGGPGGPPPGGLPGGPGGSPPGGLPPGAAGGGAPAPVQLP